MVQGANLLIAAGAAAGAWAKVAFATGAGPPIPAALLACIAIGNWAYLYRGGSPRAGAWAMVLSLVVFIGWSGYINGGLQGAATLLAPVVPLLAIILLGPNGAWGTALAIGVLLALLAAAGQAGMLPETTHGGPVTRGIALVASMLVATWVAWSHARTTQALLVENWEQANRDHLTGVPNRRHIEALLANEVARVRRAGGWLSVLMIDVDNFKRFNDDFGHQAGDVCLMAVARAIDATLRRPADAVGRYGGEEFIAVLPDTDAAGARQLAERVRAAVARLPAVAGGRPVSVTVGVASATAHELVDAAALVAAADAALYRSKSAGRNRVVPVICRPGHADPGTVVSID